jgi:hypothetical protein
VVKRSTVKTKKKVTVLSVQSLLAGTPVKTACIVIVYRTYIAKNNAKVNVTYFDATVPVKYVSSVLTVCLNLSIKRTHVFFCVKKLPQEYLRMNKKMVHEEHGIF